MFENTSESFQRIYLNRNKDGLKRNGLKVDFVNDIDVHFGEIQNTSVYYRTDSIRNILSNKYTALYRIAVKDVVDICEIAQNTSFDWKEIISEAKERYGNWIRIFLLYCLFRFFPSLEQSASS